MLLDSPGLEMVPDAVRLAVVVLGARTPSQTGVVEIRTRELGRWLGLSTSYVASNVLPVLRQSGVVIVETAEGEYGQDTGLRCQVLPLWHARKVIGHPLALHRREFATLLRLLEAVMAPGWEHRDGRVTPAGLLGARTGQGAATDRLALLLLVLEATETGRVRLCGGRASARYGRPVTTLARLLDCSPSRAERVLARLEDAGLVQRPRRQTVSGLQHRSRLVVPSVAVAHRGGGRASQEELADVRGSAAADPAILARGSEASRVLEKLQVNKVGEPGEAESVGLADSAPLHTDHPLVAGVGLDGAGSGGFSGEGRGGFRGRPERACAREDHAANTEATVADSAPPVAEDGPLRGEKPKESPVDEPKGQRAGGGRAAGRPKTVDCGMAQEQLRVDLPADLRLRVALGPVEGLWAQLSGWQQDQIQAAARAELARLAGLLMQPDTAPQLLADRLTDRLAEAGGEGRVRDAMGWLLGRGLPQRPGCPDRRCDDGIRLDTRGDCLTCASVVADRRAQRARLRAEVDTQLVGVPAQRRRAVYEERLHEDTMLEAAHAQARQERAAADVSRRRAAAARRRQTQEVAEMAWQSAPCVECGMPGAAGLCPECTYRRRTDELVREAVDLVVALRADLDDPAQVASLTARCEADTRHLIADVCRRANHGDALAAFTGREVAERIRDQRRANALRWLLASEDAEVEADAVYDTVLRTSRDHQAAQAAAEDARRRTAEYLLRQKVGQLHAVRCDKLRVAAEGAVAAGEVEDKHLAAVR
ncbi:hypothetical protein [Streptomyces sp. MN13]